MYTFNVGEKAVVKDRNCLYLNQTVSVLRTCGDRGLAVVGLQTPTGGRVEWVMHMSCLAKDTA